MTDAVLVRSHDSTKPGAIRSVNAPATGFAPLRGENRLHLSVALQYELIETDDRDHGPWKVSTRKYMYHVVTDDMTEVILFHWHPDGKSTQQGPHLHVGSSQLTHGSVVSRKTHVPTGRVALEAVLDLLIRDFGVVPLRLEWEAMLTEGQGKFEQWRSWS
ncbi:MAG: hypothetical protein ACRDQ6_22110 [Pseudonocardiaceae bacterium]